MFTKENLGKRTFINQQLAEFEKQFLITPLESTKMTINNDKTDIDQINDPVGSPGKFTYTYKVMINFTKAGKLKPTLTYTTFPEDQLADNQITGITDDFPDKPEKIPVAKTATLGFVNARIILV